MSVDQVPSKPQSIATLKRCKFAASRGLLWLMMKTLGLNGLHSLCQLVGTCEWMINFKRRRRFHERMRSMLKEEYDRTKMRKACRSYFGRIRCDRTFYLIFDLIPKGEVLRRIHFPRRTMIDDSLARGRGVYIALSHVGAHHIVALLMCFLGYKTAGVRDEREGALRRYIQQRCANSFSEVRAAKMFFSGTFPRDIYRWFKANGLLGSTLDVDPDRDPRLRRVPVVIFNEQRHFLAGPMQIALRCRAAIHQGFIVSRANFHYELMASDRLVDPDTGEDTPDTLQETIQLYADNIEAHLREHPDHISRI